MQSNNESWHNWEGNQQCTAEVCYATSVGDLQTIVKKAAAARKSIRVAGGGGGGSGAASYSVSPIVKNHDGIIVKLKGMNGGNAHNDGSGRLTVEAGMTIGDLEKLAARNHLSFAAMIVPPFVEVGGAVALGCHGSGFNHGTLSDQVVAMELVTADGNLVKVSQESDPELMKAVRCNLGTLGIIRTVTFQCVEEYKFYAVDEKSDMKTTIANIKSLVEGHDHVEVFWPPFCSDVIVKTYDKVPWARPDCNAPTGLSDAVQWASTQLGAACMAGVTHVPRLTPLWLHFYTATQQQREVVAPSNTLFHYQKYFPRRLWDVSYGFEVGADFRNFQNVWNFIADRVASYAKPKSSDCTSGSPFAYDRWGRFPQNFLIHARFIRNSDAYLAPSVGNDHTCMLQLISYFGADCEHYFDQVETHIRAHGGRPHWGKTFNTEIDFGKLYGEHMEKFKRVREQMDPNGIFLNDFTRKAFGMERNRE